MRLLNSLTKEIETLRPLVNNAPIRIYSCGPTVYERIHIGNLASFIYADTLRRVIEASGLTTQHVMNITDVDDKTIRASQQKYPDLDPLDALKKLTSEYERFFLEDIKSVGIDTNKITFVKATDHIPQMQKLIRRLIDSDYAYIAEDGIYFSIQAYKSAGKTYGQLVDINSENTGQSRINNDDYDKDNAHDFALWKRQKTGEPAWDFEILGENLRGRPGWHIECSAMSVNELGQPFELHTGGVDLKFPHHENEIAQSTAEDGQLLAKLFFHNEHLLVKGEKMSKSLGNTATLEDATEGQYFDPLTFRLFTLSSHYTKQSSINGLAKTQFILDELQALADQQFQSVKYDEGLHNDFDDVVSKFYQAFLDALSDDLNTPLAIQQLQHIAQHIRGVGLPDRSLSKFKTYLQNIDDVLGLNLLQSSVDIDSKLQEKLDQRDALRNKGNFAEADKLREQLEQQGYEIDDTYQGSRWFRKRTK
jgi:cysteinyl-tRNA synthetase